MAESRNALRMDLRNYGITETRIYRIKDNSCGPEGLWLFVAKSSRWNYESTEIQSHGNKTKVCQMVI